MDLNNLPRHGLGDLSEWYYPWTDGVRKTTPHSPNTQESGWGTSLLVYVNDIIVTENNEDEKMILKQCLAKQFKIKKLERLKYFLRIEVAYHRFGLFFFLRQGIKWVTPIYKKKTKIHNSVSILMIFPKSSII